MSSRPGQTPTWPTLNFFWQRRKNVFKPPSLSSFSFFFHFLLFQANHGRPQVGLHHHQTRTLIRNNRKARTSPGTALYFIWDHFSHASSHINNDTHTHTMPTGVTLSLISYIGTAIAFVFATLSLGKLAVTWNSGRTYAYISLLLMKKRMMDIIK